MGPLSPIRITVGFAHPSHALNGRRRYLPVFPVHRVLAIAMLILFASATGQSMPFSEYKARMTDALKALSNVSKIETEKDANRSVGIPALLDSIREKLPLEETIEWNGSRVRVNNRWLEQDLQTYQQLPFGSMQRAQILQNAIERFEALVERLDEVDPSEAAEGTGTKQPDRARLDAITSRGEFTPQPPQENIFARAWRKFKEWLNNMFPGGGGLAPGSMSWLSFIAMIVIFALAAAVLAYAISKLIPLLQRKSDKEERGEKGARVVLGESLSPDKTASDLMKEAEELARRGELRVAIRKAYIALLVELGDRKILTLAQHKTNRDYLRSVRDKRTLLTEMQKLTSSFENHWYGSKETSSDDWTMFRAGYEKVLSFE